MPRGRFLNKEICIDRKVNELSCYESMLAFTWIIPHLDCNGLTYGDPAVVRSMVFPRRNDITVEQMESYIKEWQKKGLVKIYEKGDEKYIWLPNFAKHQIGLKKEREAKSGIPLPDDFPIDAEQYQDSFLQESGNTPEVVGNNVKLSKVNDDVNDDADSEKKAFAVSNIGISEQMIGIWNEFTGKNSKAKEWDPIIHKGANSADLRTALTELLQGGKQLPRSPDRCVSSVLFVVQKRKAGNANSEREKSELFIAPAGAAQ